MRCAVSTSGTHRWSGRARAGLLGVLFVLYVIARVSCFVPSDAIVRVGDTPRYLNSTEILNWSFWTAPRPLTVPFVYRLVGQNVDTIVLMQLIASILAWGLLALAVAGVMRTPRLRPFAFAAILLLGLAKEIVVWDRVLLTDSIMFSLIAALVAAWLWFLSGPRWARVVLLLGTATLWVFVGAVNAPIAFLVGLGVAFLGIVGRRQTQLVIGAGMLLLAVLAGYWIQATGVWETPLMNVIARRVLPFPERTAFFMAHGMPISPVLAGRAGKTAWDNDWAFYKDPALKDFREWFRASGPATHAAFLLAHPDYAFRAPFRSPEALLWQSFPWYQRREYAAMVSRRGADLLYLRTGLQIWILAGWALIGIGVLVAARTGRPEWWLTAILVAFFYPHLLLAWHGDSNGIGQHVSAAVVQLRLGVWMFGLLALDQVMSRRRDSSGAD